MLIVIDKFDYLFWLEIVNIPDTHKRFLLNRTFVWPIAHCLLSWLLKYI